MLIIEKDTFSDIVLDYMFNGYTVDTLKLKYAFTEEELHTILVSEVPRAYWKNGKDV